MQRKRQVTSARQAAISPLVRVDRDQGIEKNLDAAPVQNTMRDNVKYNVKNAVLPLIGEVIAQALRSESASRLPTHHRPPGRVRCQGHFLQHLALRHQLVVLRRQAPKQLRTANPLWGAPRIHAELQKLGIDITETTVAKYIRRRPTNPPSQSWRTFLSNHASQLASTYDEAPAFLTRDRDDIYGWTVRNTLQAMGIQEVVTAPHSPWQNPFVERVIGSIRRECLDHVIIWNEKALRRHLRRYFAYYHAWRPHLSLEKDAPIRERPSHSLPAGSCRSLKSAVSTITTNGAPRRDKPVQPQSVPPAITESRRSVCADAAGGQPTSARSNANRLASRSPFRPHHSSPPAPSAPPNRGDRVSGRDRCSRVNRQLS